MSASEQRVSFRVGDSWCRLNSLELGAGVRLDVTACAYEPSFSLSVVQPPAQVQFVVSRGSVLEARGADGVDFEFGGNTLELVRTRSPRALSLRAAREARLESVSLSMSEARLRELLGASVLPEALRTVFECAEPGARWSQASGPRLARLLDELLNADATSRHRSLWYEAKSLELLALISEQLEADVEERALRLSAREVDGLERVRRTLVERLAAPPTLSELARGAGFNETKLKGAFRARFGSSVFGYLRRVRMEEARRLLLARELNVTEVAVRVGYVNPSKFAAAFRRQFGVSPSCL